LSPIRMGFLSEEPGTEAASGAAAAGGAMGFEGAGASGAGGPLPRPAIGLDAGVAFMLLSLKYKPYFYVNAMATPQARFARGPSEARHISIHWAVSFSCNAFWRSRWRRNGKDTRPSF